MRQSKRVRGVGGGKNEFFERKTEYASCGAGNKKQLQIQECTTQWLVNIQGCKMYLYANQNYIDTSQVLEQEGFVLP